MPLEAAAEGHRRLLRVSLLSLEGRRRPRGGGGEGATLQNGRVCVVAWGGFRTTFPPDAVQVSSSQYRALFEGEGGMLAVESEGEEVQCGGGGSCNEEEGFTLRWRTGPIASGGNGIGNKKGPGERRIPAEQVEGAAHHLEIELPPAPPPEDRPENGSQPPDVIEIHLCVVCTRCAHESDSEEQACNEDDLDENDDNSLGADVAGESQRACCGIAHLRLNEDATISPEYERPGGKVETLPVRLKRPRNSSDIFRHSGSMGDDVAFAENATLSIRVEIACQPVGQHIPIEPRYYVKSEWGGAKSAPASVVYQGSRNDEGNDSTRAVNGLGQMLRRAASTLSLMASLNNPAQRLLENEKRDDVVGRIVEVVVSPEEENNTARSKALQSGAPDNTRRLDRKDTSGTAKSRASNAMSLATFSERFLCGASLGGVGDALRMAAAAGHHCDEDHVGLYVVDSDEAGSSIATADVA
ncbi:hypothetical protein ACHAXT_005040 [Thalassiosira profunda]